MFGIHVDLIRIGNGYFVTGFSCLGLKIPHLIILVLVDGLLDQFVVVVDSVLSIFVGVMSVAKVVGI